MDRCLYMLNVIFPWWKYIKNMNIRVWPCSLSVKNIKWLKYSCMYIFLKWNMIFFIICMLCNLHFYLNDFIVNTCICISKTIKFGLIFLLYYLFLINLLVHCTLLLKLRYSYCVSKFILQSIETHFIEK